MYRMLIVLVLVSLCANTASALPGSGTLEDPYRIQSLADFDEFASDPNYWAGFTRLETDVNLAGRTYITAVIAPDTNNANWDFDGTPFTGVFDGNAHKITNLTIDDFGIGNDFLGLFGCIVEDGEVRNVGLEEVFFIGDNSIGGLVGANGDWTHPGGAISNCYSTGGVYGRMYIGGIVGINVGSVSNCYSAGSVSGDFYIGGLVGQNYDDAGSISNCYSTGSVSGTGFYSSYVGGLVGENNSGDISNCYSTGDVSGTGRYVGGLVGENIGSVSNCYSIGSVSGNMYVGGLVGENYRTISNCYSTGDISGNDCVGGLSGSNSGTISVCFWDIQTSGLATSAGGTGLTTSQMQTESSFFCWAADGVWTIDEGKDYPRLWWENALGNTITRDYYYGGGSGTQDDPYLIYTAEQLSIVGLIECDWDRHFKLMADIDLSGYDGKDGRPAFNIIGNYYNSFTGVFDGNDHIISNVDVNLPGSDYVGLFGYLRTNGQIKNLGVEDISVFGHNYVGGLVGYNYGSITNCYSTGDVSGRDYIGGLVGDNLGSISNCYSTGNVNGGDHVGGLVGDNEGTISNCYSTCPVIGTGEQVEQVGGLVGGNGGTLSNCYSTSIVWGTNEVGGLVGYNYGTISNCYSTGDVNGVDEVGGLVGYNYGSITNCYSTGTVSGTSYVGGLVGGNGGLITGCFWDIQTSVQSTSAGGMGKTTAEMQDINTFIEAGWDFLGETTNGTCNFWMMPETEGYPVLSTLNGYISREPSGSGTAEDPYVITDANELGTIWYRPSACYVMGDDIDLAGISWSVPVVLSFSGVFDGNEHTLRNLDVNVPGNNYVGLFGRLTTAGQIWNLRVENISIFGSNYVGGLVGYNYGSISNCYSTGSVSGGEDVGGLVGWNSSFVSDCYSTANVNGGGCVGGLVGDNFRGSVSNCYSTSSVSGDNCVGGLVGGNYGGSISNCYSTGDVNGAGNVGGLVGQNGTIFPLFWSLPGYIYNSYSTGNVQGDWSVGGLVGLNYNGAISRCYSTGSVLGSGSQVGGLVGTNGHDGAHGEEIDTISNCYSTSSVTGDSRVGGLVGENYGSVSNCYSIGSVIGSNRVGCLIGAGAGAINCFWDIETSDCNTSAGGTGKTTAEMQTRSTFTDAAWDFVNVWDICEGTNYPRLRWEIEAGDFICPYGVDFMDFAVIASAWLSKPNEPDWNLACDISEPKDNIIDELDLAVFCDNWLASHWFEPLEPEEPEEPEECFPKCRPDYTNWVAFGRPDCWCCPTQCYGDANCDGIVDDNDVGRIEPKIDTKYPSPMYDPCVDFNHDGYIYFDDLYILGGWYGTSPPDNCLMCP